MHSLRSPFKLRAINLQSRIVFQNVARHGSFSAAAKNLPFRIGEAAVRKHIRELEEQFGARLLDRQPVRLTAAGRVLYDFDRPLLEKLLHAGEHLKRKFSPRLTAGVTGSAAKMFLLGPVHAWLSDPAREPIDCRFGSLQSLRPLMQTGELDLLITALDGPPPAGFASHILATFPLVLIVPENSPLQTAAILWKPGTLHHRLIAPEADDPVTLAFERGLARGGITWPARLTCDSPASLVQLVTAGLGYGLSLSALPCGAKDGAAKPADEGSPSLPSRGIRELLLKGCDVVPIVALWRPEDSQRLQDALRLVRSL